MRHQLPQLAGAAHTNRVRGLVNAVAHALDGFDDVVMATLAPQVERALGVER